MCKGLEILQETGLYFFEFNEFIDREEQRDFEFRGGFSFERIND